MLLDGLSLMLLKLCKKIHAAEPLLGKCVDHGVNRVQGARACI